MVAFAVMCSGMTSASTLSLEFKEGEAVPVAILAGASLAFFALTGFEA